MFRSIFFVSLALLPFASRAFAPQGFQASSSSFLTASVMSNDLGSSTIAKDNYDVVKVDLDDGRDYPIYIGTGYSDQEGGCFRVARRIFVPIAFVFPSHMFVESYRLFWFCL